MRRTETHDDRYDAKAYVQQWLWASPQRQSLDMEWCPARINDVVSMLLDYHQRMNSPNTEIIEEPVKAGCAPGNETIGYLAWEISRLRAALQAIAVTGYNNCSHQTMRDIARSALSPNDKMSGVDSANLTHKEQSVILMALRYLADSHTGWDLPASNLHNKLSIHWENSMNSGQATPTLNESSHSSY